MVHIIYITNMTNIRVSAGWR